MYTRRDLVGMYGPRMAGRIAGRARKLVRGRYMGWMVLQAIDAISQEKDFDPGAGNGATSKKIESTFNGIRESRPAW